MSHQAVVQRSLQAGPRYALGGARRDSTTTALRVLGLASLALTLTTETVPLALDFARAEPDAWFGIALLLASQLLTLVALLLPRHHDATPYVMLTLLAAGIAEMMSHSGEFPVAEYLLPGYWLFPQVALSLRSKQREVYGCFALVGAAVMAVVQYLYVGAENWVELADFLWILQPTLLVLLFGDAVISIDRARSEAVERSLTAQQEQELQKGLDQGRREADRILNEHVLQALSLVGRPGASRRIVEELRGAWATVEVADSRRRTTRLERQLRLDRRLRAADLRVEGESTPVPMALARAFCDAVAAAVEQRTADADSPAPVAVVSQEEDLRRVSLTLPEAKGHRSSARATHLAEVRRLMADVGGQATLDSNPDGGATVELRWPRDAAGAQAAAWREAPNRMVRSTLTRTAWPSLVTGLLMTVMASQTTIRPGIALLAGVLTFLVGAVTAGLLRRHRIGRAQMALVFLVAWGAWSLNLWLVPTSPEVDYPLWLAWSASALVHLVVLSETLAVGAVLAVAWTFIQTAGLAVRYDSWSEVWWHSFLVITGAGDVVITLLVLWVARTAAAQQAEASAIATRLRAATTMQQMASDVRQHWSQLVTQDALPLLDGIAAGDLDPDDPRVQARARAVEEALRAEQGSA